MLTNAHYSDELFKHHDGKMMSGIAYRNDNTEFIELKPVATNASFDSVLLNTEDALSIAVLSLQHMSEEELEDLHLAILAEKDRREESE